MNNAWRLFLTIEVLLFIGALGQILQEKGLTVFFIVGVVCLLSTIRKRKSVHFSRFRFILGVILIAISFINTFAMWLMLVLAILFFGLKGINWADFQWMQKAPWRKKELLMVETTNTSRKSGRRFKRSWITNERIGDRLYEWEDINIDILFGDTIIDLGNTLLPKQDNIVIIRKGFGKTRVFVPLGIGILLEHSTFYGTVKFADEKYTLKNESLRLYSDDYDMNARRLKILTNTLVGDVEVIQV